MIFTFGTDHQTSRVCNSGNKAIEVVVFLFSSRSHDDFDRDSTTVVLEVRILRSKVRDQRIHPLSRPALSIVFRYLSCVFANPSHQNPEMYLIRRGCLYSVYLQLCKLSSLANEACHGSTSTSFSLRHDVTNWDAFLIVSIQPSWNTPLSHLFNDDQHVQQGLLQTN